MRHERLTAEILGACFEVAAELGSGFLELVYQNALMVALEGRRLRVACQKPVVVRFRGHAVGEFYADLVVEDLVIVELKAVKLLAPEHLAQTINYLNVTGHEIGLLVNFGAPRIEYRRLHAPRSRIHGEAGAGSASGQDTKRGSEADTHTAADPVLDHPGTELATRGGRGGNEQGWTG